MFDLFVWPLLPYYTHLGKQEKVLFRISNHQAHKHANTHTYRHTNTNTNTQTHTLTHTHKCSEW